jgi:hypothetical protein
VIFGWSLLVIAMALTGALSYSFVRIMIEEHSYLPKRPRDPLTTRAKRLGRIVIEPVIGR